MHYLILTLLVVMVQLMLVNRGQATVFILRIPEACIVALKMDAQWAIIALKDVPLNKERALILSWVMPG